MRNTSRVTQPLRALAAASTATFVALFSHVIGGGAAPTLLGVLLPLLISLLVCSLLAGRALSLVRLSLSVAASQVLFHASFVLSALLAGTPLSHAHHAGHGAHALIPALHGEVVMWIMHLLAAVITIFALYRGEQAIHQLKRISDHVRTWFSRRVTRPITAPVSADALVTVDVRQSPVAMISRIHGTTLTWRGPPHVSVI